MRRIGKGVHQMKSLLFASVAVLSAAVSVAAPKKDAYDILPRDKDEKYPTTVVWSLQNDEAISAATADEVVAGFVANDESAAALLSSVRGAYSSDPLALTQIAAVSQWVMQPDPCALLFWKPSRSAGRRVWVNALLSLAETADDNYVKTFCLDQLRWCASPCPCVIRRVALIGVKAGDRGVKEMSDLVLRELEMR